MYARRSSVTAAGSTMDPSGDRSENLRVPACRTARSKFPAAGSSSAARRSSISLPCVCTRLPSNTTTARSRARTTPSAPRRHGRDDARSGAPAAPPMSSAARAAVARGPNTSRAGVVPGAGGQASDCLSKGLELVAARGAVHEMPFDLGELVRFYGTEREDRQRVADLLVIHQRRTPTERRSGRISRAPMVGVRSSTLRRTLRHRDDAKSARPGGAGYDVCLAPDPTRKTRARRSKSASLWGSACSRSTT